MSYFTALPLASGVWLDALPPPPPGVRLVHPDDLHLTIAFFGAVTEEAALAGWQALRWPLGPTEVSLGAVAPMGSGRRPSAFAALLAHGREAVEAAMGATRDACCDAAGAPREARPPKAHVTLARPGRNASSRDRAAGEAWASSLELRAVRVTLDRVALFGRSEPGAASRYRVVVQRALTEPAEPGA